MKKHNTGLRGRDNGAWAGRLFVLPWFIGMLLFFGLPLVQSLVYSFQDVKIGKAGFDAEWLGFANYLRIFTRDPDYVKILAEAIQNMLAEVPIILIFSLFIAVILNRPFRGRVWARAVMFLPVIVSTGVVMSILKGDVYAQSVMNEGASSGGAMFHSSGFQEMLQNAGVDLSVINFIVSIINKFFDTVWKTGVQILLFLSSLQAIPRSAYEAAAVEGSTEWETFWLITFPLVSPMILVNIVYSVVDSFTDYGNAVLQYITSTAFSEYEYAYSAALAWVYFLSLLILIGLICFIAAKKVFYMSD